MRLPAVLLSVAVLAGAAVCVRLGVWQLGRLDEKRALNRAMHATLSAPAAPYDSTAAPEDVAGHRVALRGRFDQSLHVLLAARFHQGDPGVEVVTPLKLEGGGAVLVDRGWLPAEDAVAARPQDYPEPDSLTVVGVAEAIGRGVRGSAIRTLESDSVTLLSTSALDRDSLAVRLPYAVAPVLVRQLPGAGVPTVPTRLAPAPLDESIHLGYAIQWFAIGAILLGGSGWLAWSRRRSARLAARQAAAARVP